MARSIWSGYRVGSSTGGPECEELERELERYYGVPHARVFNSATSALYGAIVAAIPRFTATHIDCPALSMSASAAAIEHTGRFINFVDIGEDYCLDWDQRSLPDNPVMLVHLFGHHAKVPAGFESVVIHDAAQSPTLRPDALRPQDVWVYSLNQHKIIQCGEGGYALTFSQEIADRLHAVRNHGECNRSDILGWNFRMTEMQAALAREEFNVLDKRMAERVSWATKMRIEYELPDDRGNIDWFLYPIRTGSPDAEAKRVGGRVGYHKPLPELPYFKSSYPQIKREHYPNTYRIAEELIVIDPLTV